MAKCSDVLIVGAGISGIVAAQQLKAAGKTVVLVDKGKSLGGRLATRRIGTSGKADHGAQFFTARSAQFKTLVEDWLNHKWIFEWARAWPSNSNQKITAIDSANSYPRYAATNGFNQLAKHLATGLDIRLSSQITKVELSKSATWVASSDDNLIFESKALILTAPVPQSLALLKAGLCDLNSADFKLLQSIQYAPCLCGIFLIEGEVNLLLPGAIQRPNLQINWIADNQLKGISPAEKVITVHVSPEYSRLWWEEDEDTILSHIKQELKAFLKPNSRVIQTQLKRWRYALVETPSSQRFLSAETPAPLFFVGDAFAGDSSDTPNIESAVLSGCAAGKAISNFSM